MQGTIYVHRRVSYCGMLWFSLHNSTSYNPFWPAILFTIGTSIWPELASEVVKHKSNVHLLYHGVFMMNAFECDIDAKPSFIACQFPPKFDGKSVSALCMCICITFSLTSAAIILFYCYSGACYICLCGRVRLFICLWNNLREFIWYKFIISLLSTLCLLCIISFCSSFLKLCN